MESSLFRYDPRKTDFEYRTIHKARVFKYLDDGWEVFIPVRRFGAFVTMVMERSVYKKYLERHSLANLLYVDLIKRVRKEERKCK